MPNAGAQKWIVRLWNGNDLGTPAAIESKIENAIASPAAGDSARLEIRRTGGVPDTRELVDSKRCKSGYRLSTRSTLDVKPGTGASANEKRISGSSSPDDRKAA